MNIICGTDIIEIERVEKSIKNIGDKFINRIFTEKEIAYCEGKKKQKYQHYAARFAAKEATYKALSEYLSNKEWNWKSFEIINNENNKPEIFVHLELPEMKKIDISISHCREYAVANVVGLIERK